MVMQRSKLEQTQRCIIFALVLAIFIGVLLLLSGCDATKRALRAPDGYSPGENFGDGGATRCGYRTTVHADLPPCR